MPSPNAELADALVRHRLWLLRFEGGAVKEAVGVYTSRTGPLLEKLRLYQRQLAEGRPLSAAQVRDVERLRGQVEKAIREARDQVQDGLQGRLLEVVKAEAKIVPARLGEALPEGVEAKSVPLAQLAELLRAPFGGQSYGQRIDVALLQVRDRIDAGLAAALEGGAGMERAARLLERAVGEIGGGRRRLVRIARTEIQRVANAAAQRTYAANRDVLKAVQYLATLDNRTCPVCMERHEETFPLDPDTGRHAGPEIPQHPNCRCFYAPVTKSWAELGQAEGEGDGEPAADMDFDAWLQRQGAEIRDGFVRGPSGWVDAAQLREG